MKKKFLIFAGAIFSIFNVLPIPWPLRLLWFKVLYSITLKSTLLFPSIIRWTRAQNMIYKMGKQEGEAYESIVQLEMVLQYLDSIGTTSDQVARTMDQAEAQAIPPDQLGIFIARKILDPLTAEKILEDSLRSTRY